MPGILKREGKRYAKAETRWESGRRQGDEVGTGLMTYRPRNARDQSHSHEPGRGEVSSPPEPSEGAFSVREDISIASLLVVLCHSNPKRHVLFKAVKPITRRTFNKGGRRGAWVAHSIKHPASAQVVISRFVGSSPASGSVLTARSLEPALDSASPSLSAPAPLVLALSLSLPQKEINIKKKNLFLKVGGLDVASAKWA